MTNENPEPASELQATRDQLELERQRLANRKLELENLQLSRPLIRQLPFWQAAGPLVVALVGAILAWSTGWFDVKSQQVRNSKELLEAQTARLEAQKATLTAETARLETAKLRVGGELGELQQQFMLTTNQLRILAQQRDEKESLVKALSGQVEKLSQENEAARKLITQISTLQVERDGLQKENLQLRTRLATAYAHGLNLALTANTTLRSFASGTNFIATFSEMQGFESALTKWNESHESDFDRYSLINFSNIVHRIIDPSLISKAQKIPLPRSGP